MAPCIPSDGCHRLSPRGGAILGDAPDHLERPVDRRHQVHVDNLLEPFDRIDARLAGFLVDAHRKIVARDAGGRHAHRDGIELAADRIENRRAKRLVGRIARKAIGDLPAGLRVDFVGDCVDVLAHVHERHRAHVAARQFDGDRPSDAARGTCDYSDFSCDIHICP